MTDPRLNSMHLELPRRQQFRAARDQLMQGRGENTIQAEAQGDRGGGAPDLTDFQQAGSADAASAPFVLMDKDSVIPLKVGLNTIGRLNDNDVVLPDAYVSRRHCAILIHADGRCELHDVASKNGTILNGQRIQGPTALKTGDEIRMCTKYLVFSARGAESGDPATQAVPVA